MTEHDEEKLLREFGKGLHLLISMAADLAEDLERREAVGDSPVAEKILFYGMCLSIGVVMGPDETIEALDRDEPMDGIASSGFDVIRKVRQASEAFHALTESLDRDDLERIRDTVMNTMKGGDFEGAMSEMVSRMGEDTLEKLTQMLKEE